MPSLHFPLLQTVPGQKHTAGVLSNARGLSCHGAGKCRACACYSGEIGRNGEDEDVASAMTSVSWQLLQHVRGSKTILGAIGVGSLTVDMLPDTGLELAAIPG